MFWASYLTEFLGDKVPRSCAQCWLCLLVPIHLALYVDMVMRGKTQKERLKRICIRRTPRTCRTWKSWYSVPEERDSDTGWQQGGWRGHEGLGWVDSQCHRCEESTKIIDLVTLHWHEKGVSIVCRRERKGLLMVSKDFMVRQKKPCARGR